MKDETQSTEVQPIARVLGPRGFTDIVDAERGGLMAMPTRSYPDGDDGGEFSMMPRPAIIAVEGSLPDRDERPVRFQEIPIEPGLTVVLGAAGTGKSTTLSEIAGVVDELGYAVKPVHLNETDYDDDKGVEQWLPSLHRAMVEAAVDERPAVVVIDSLRHFATISTGYSARLGNSGFDLTTLQALSDLDRAARRLRIRLVASLFLSTYQLTKGDLADDLKMSKILRTIAYDVDGCATTTMLLGPTRRNPGQFYATTRVDRRKSFEGVVIRKNAARDSQNAMLEPNWSSPLSSFSAVSAVGRSDAAVYAAGLADYDYRAAQPAQPPKKTNSSVSDVRDPYAVVSQLDREANPPVSAAGKLLQLTDLGGSASTANLLAVPDLTVDDHAED